MGASGDHRWSAVSSAGRRDFLLRHSGLTSIPSSSTKVAAQEVDLHASNPTAHGTSQSRRFDRLCIWRRLGTDIRRLTAEHSVHPDRRPGLRVAGILWRNSRENAKCQSTRGDRNAFHGCLRDAAVHPHAGIIADGAAHGTQWNVACDSLVWGSVCRSQRAHVSRTVDTRTMPSPASPSQHRLHDRHVRKVASDAQ